MILNPTKIKWKTILTEQNEKQINLNLTENYFI